MGTYCLCFLFGILLGGLILYYIKQSLYPPTQEVKYWQQNERLFFDILKTLRQFDTAGTEQALFHHLFKLISRLYDLDIVIYTYTSGKILSFLTAHTKLNPPKRINLMKISQDKPTYQGLSSFQALIHGKPFGYQDISGVPIYQEILKNTPFLAAYSFPIKISGVPELTVTFYAREKNYFTPFFINLFDRIFTEVGQHISQRRLLNKTTDELRAYQERLKAHIQKLTLERKKSEAATKAKTEFLANISHELRTPLTAIIGFSESMQSQLFGPLNDTYQTYTGYITTSAHHLLDLINDLLDLTRAETGHQKLNFQPVLFIPLVEECLTLIPKNQKQITFKKPKKILTVIADERALKQIVVNLLSNAIKFTKNNGTITLTARLKQDGALQFSVQDNGIGIAKAHQAKLFTPFSQVENVLTRTHTGTGLGLALVKKLCTLQDITLALSSVPKKGTKITLTFPKKHVVLSP